MHARVPRAHRQLGATADGEIGTLLVLEGLVLVGKQIVPPGMFFEERGPKLSGFSFRPSGIRSRENTPVASDAATSIATTHHR